MSSKLILIILSIVLHLVQSEKLGIEDSLLEHTHFYYNESIKREIRLTDKSETHTIKYHIISKIELNKKEPYLVFIPRNKIGHLTSINASYKLATQTEYTKTHLRPSVHSDLSFNNVDYVVYEAEFPLSLPTSGGNSTKEYDLQLTLKYLKPFQISPIETPRSETHTNLLYKDYSGVFSIYKTTLMMTTLNYESTSNLLLNYTGASDSDLPIAFHSESKELIYGPYKDIIPYEDTDNFNLYVIEGLFKTTKGIPEIENFQRTIYYSFWNNKKARIWDWFSVKNLHDNYGEQFSFSKNLRILRINLNDGHNKKVIRKNQNNKLIYDKINKSLLVKFSEEIKPGESGIVEYLVLMKSKKIGISPILEDYYFGTSRVVLKAPLFRRFKKIKSKVVFEIETKSFFFGLLKPEYAVYEDRFVDCEKIAEEIEVIFEWDYKEVSKIIMTLIGILIGYFMFK